MTIYKAIECLTNNAPNYWIVSDKTFRGEVMAMCENEVNAKLIAELLNTVQRLTWKAKDQLYALKNSKCDYTESNDYITQLKEYISNAETLLQGG